MEEEMKTEEYQLPMLLGGAVLDRFLNKQIPLSSIIRMENQQMDTLCKHIGQCVQFQSPRSGNSYVGVVTDGYGIFENNTWDTYLTGPVLFINGQRVPVDTITFEVIESVNTALQQRTRQAEIFASEPEDDSEYLPVLVNYEVFPCVVNQVPHQYRNLAAQRQRHFRDPNYREQVRLILKKIQEYGL